MRYIAGLWLCGIACLAAAQTRPSPTTSSSRDAVDVSVDPRVELISILFNLAGNREYNQPRIESYARDVAEHFSAFRDHPAVQLARQLGRTAGVGYDAPMSLAVHLRAPSLELALPLAPWPDGLDGRWQHADVPQFPLQVGQFAADSHFDEFFASHRAFYEQAVGRMRQTLQYHARLGWFDEFFGQRPQARFHVVLGMLNGGACYGPHAMIDGREEFYCILGVWSGDPAGAPVFPKSVVPVLIHEFAHSYANPLVDQHMDELRGTGEKLFAARRALMRPQAYGNAEAVLRESLVRACVVRYRYDTDGVAAAMAEVGQQHAMGFDWVGRLSAALDEYEQRRDTYPTLGPFMPRLVRAFNDAAAGISLN